MLSGQERDQAYSTVPRACLQQYKQSLGATAYINKDITFLSGFCNISIFRVTLNRRKLIDQLICLYYTQTHTWTLLTPHVSFSLSTHQHVSLSQQRSMSCSQPPPWSPSTDDSVYNEHSQTTRPFDLSVISNITLSQMLLYNNWQLSYKLHLSYLHWLPVHYRIQCKIATLTYKTLATCQPSYLYDLFQVHQPPWALRSSTQQLLHVPYMSTDFGRHAFSYSSPATWNSTPTSIKNGSSLYSFKHHLKSHLIDQLINN